MFNYVFVFPNVLWEHCESNNQDWIIQNWKAEYSYSLTYQRELYVVWFLSISSSSSSRMCSKWHLNCLRSTQSYSWTTNHVGKKTLRTWGTFYSKSVWIQVSSPSMTTPVPTDCWMSGSTKGLGRACAAEMLTLGAEVVGKPKKKHDDPMRPGNGWTRISDVDWLKWVEEIFLGLSCCGRMGNLELEIFRIGPIAKESSNFHLRDFWIKFAEDAWRC